MPQVVDALDQAFERSFDTAPQTNQRFYLGIDVSGSMASGAGRGCAGTHSPDGGRRHGHGHRPQGA